MKSIVFSTLLGLALLTGCNQKSAENTSTPESTPKAEAPKSETAKAEQPKGEQPAAGKEVAIISTTEGDMTVEFWPEVAPKTVANFKKLAKEGFYEGTIFHRIVDGFMVQGGDMLSKDPSKENEYGTGNPGFTVPAEFSDRKHERGVISMARLGHDVNSASSQFFICLAPTPQLDGSYTCFGKLIKGDDVLEKIGKTPVTRNVNGEPSKPTKRIEIKSVKIVPAEQAK